MTEPFRDPLPTLCDVLVVGAGPAGLSAAIAASQAGARRVVLLDGRDPWREPVSCAEGVRESTFLRWCPIDPAPYKRGQITSCIFGTEGASFEWKSRSNAGWIVDRSAFHAGLAERCRQSGVVCHFRQRVGSVAMRNSDGYFLVETAEAKIMARRVIDASGPGSSIGREAGFSLGKDDLETAAFALVEGLTYPVEAIQLWFHPSYSPGGYAWIFPRDAKTANVGVVVGRGAPISSRKGLEVFLESLAPGSFRGIQIRGGAIPNGSGRGRIAHQGLYKVGDAAGMVNAISRGGIVESLCAGRLAGTHAAASLLCRDGDGSHERAYVREWNRAFGSRQRWAVRIKPWVNRIPTKVLARTFQQLSRTPGGEIPWTAVVGTLASSSLKALLGR